MYCNNLICVPCVIKVRFEGITGDGFHSDIAIDDIKLSNNASCTNVGDFVPKAGKHGCVTYMTVLVTIMFGKRYRRVIFEVFLIH